MKKTLQDQYLLIKEGKGHVGVFLTEAKRQFPNIVRNAATLDEAVASLKSKNIIAENVFSVMPAILDRPKKESYETAFEAFLAEAKKNEDEKVKAEEKKVSKPVEEDLEKAFDYSDEKNPDNMIFDQIMTGYYAEMKDPKNADKTMQQLKDIVFKNLEKDPIYYTKNGQFGVKDLGYVTEAPGLGEPKEPKGKYKSSGYGDLKEGVEKFMSDVKDAATKSNKKFTPEEIKAKLKQKREAELKRRKEAGESLEELSVRKAIQEMIDMEMEEAYQLVNINPIKSDKERNERDPQPFKTTYIDPAVIDSLRKNQHLRILRSPSNPEQISGIAIRARLVPISSKNLGKTTDNLNKLGIDIPSDLKNYLTDANNIGGEKQLPTKEGVTELYKLLNNATLNQNGSLVIKVPNPNYTKTMESLQESVEKDLADINKEAEHEVLQAKLDKIDALIDHRRSKLSKLDEDEDMKALTDKKKVKELEKDIKKLEVARKKIEKMMSKFKGKKAESKEVIDETENDGLDQQTVNDITTKYNEIYIKNGVVTDREIEDIAEQYPFDQKTDIMDYLEGYSPADEFDM
jgi:hypothetical protein